MRCPGRVNTHTHTHAHTHAEYLTGARREGRDWRDVQNLQLIHVPVQDDGGSVHISGPGRRVHLREVVIDELADYRSFPHSGSADDCDTQRLHHSWSTSSAPWTATTTTDRCDRPEAQLAAAACPPPPPPLLPPPLRWNFQNLQLLFF